MKKLICIATVIASIIAFYGASAEEIRFRDMEWGQSLAQTVTPYINEYKDSLYIDCDEIPGIEAVSTAEMNDAECEISLHEWFAASPISEEKTSSKYAYRLSFSTKDEPLYVAGHKSSIEMYFFPKIVDGEKVIQNAESSELYMAGYYFFVGKEEQEAVFDDLVSKLEALYHEAEKENVYSELDIYIAKQFGDDTDGLTPIGYIWSINGTNVRITKDSTGVQITYWTEECEERIHDLVYIETKTNSDGL